MKKEKMTGWYDPGQLARTGVQVAISTIFGRHADRRQLQGLAKEGEPPAKPFYDAPPVAGPNGEFWFDYIADVGDGFNPTYTMACCVTEPELTLNGEQTQQGQLLIFGGDEVYPLGQPGKLQAAAYRSICRRVFETEGRPAHPRGLCRSRQSRLVRQPGGIRLQFHGRSFRANTTVLRLEIFPGAKLFRDQTAGGLVAVRNRHATRVRIR